MPNERREDPDYNKKGSGEIVIMQSITTEGVHLIMFTFQR